MKAKVISYNLADLQATEDILNDWLEEVGDICIDRCVQLGTAGPDRDAGGLVIFYEYEDEVAAPRPKKKGQVCRQCKKRPPIKGMKICEECREYQANYRKQQRENKKARYP